MKKSILSLRNAEDIAILKHWFKVRKVIEIMMYFCARAQVQYFLANFLETAINHATGNLRIRTREIWLILPEATAFGVRLSHASRKKLDSLRTAQ